MSIETSIYNNVNPWKYLIIIQEQQDDIHRNPSLWTPWCFTKRLKELQSKSTCQTKAEMSPFLPKLKCHQAQGEFERDAVTIK